MRRPLQILTILAALAVPCGVAAAQSIEAKVDSVKKAADSLAALAKDSAKTGNAPRASDPAAKPLLDTVFNTKSIEGKRVPWADVRQLSDWNQAAVRVGLIYYLAGTGTEDVNVVAKDQKLTQQANANTIKFAPEMGMYYDAKMHLYAAMIDSAIAQIEAATPEQRRDPELRKAMNAISDGTAFTMLGLMHALVLEGMPLDWQLLRVGLLLQITPQAVKFMAPNDRQVVRNAAAEAAALINNPDIKSAVNIVARAFAGV
jgi:hypothetical protein